MRRFDQLSHLYPRKGKAEEEGGMVGQAPCDQTRALAVPADHLPCDAELLSLNEKIAWLFLFFIIATIQKRHAAPPIQVSIFFSG
jgi:hypothetical protein